MADLQRVGLLLPKMLLKRLKKEAEARHTTLSSLVCQILQTDFPRKTSQAAHLEAVSRLKEMSLPVCSWAQMRSEIDKGRTA